MATIKHDMSWEDVEECISLILGQFKDHGYEPETIIGVAKGGVIPSTLIHQAFPKARYYTIHVQTYVGEFILEKPKIIGSYPSSLMLDQTSTLIVDDILDTGATRDFLQTIYPMATYAFMTCRQASAGSCLYRGRIYGEGWITFPWERKLEAIEVPF